MSLLIMQHSVDFDLEELESRLYSQVFHSTENWDQTPNHPVLNKVPEQQRQVTTYSISNSNQTGHTLRYWDGKTQRAEPSPLNENAANNSKNNSDTTTKTTEPSDKPLTSDNNNTPQNNNEKNVARTVGFVEEYIGLDSLNSTNNQHARNQNETTVDFSKDDLHFQQNFFCDSQDKLVQQSEIQTTNNLNTNLNINNDIFANLKNLINSLEQENTKAARNKARRLRCKLKHKQIKHERRTKRLIKLRAKEQRCLNKLGKNPNNNIPSFSFVNKYNKIQRQIKNIQNFYNSPIVKQSVEINEIPKNQQEIINNVDDLLVISSDSDSDSSDDVIEIPLPELEIVCIDSSSENSNTDDSSVCVDNSIVEKSSTTNPKPLDSIAKENIVPNSPKLENLNDYETSDINRETQLKTDGEIINETKTEDKKEETEVMKEIEENATTLYENKEKADEIKSPNKNISNTSITEIEKERAELLCTPDSNTNDFMAHDVCNLNKTNFCFNFNLHDPDLDITGKEIPKSGPSITDVYETESSCSEAGTTSKNQSSYFNEVDFESPIKEIFAEPDLAKFSSFITPIRNRNISNVANSTPDLTPVKTKAGVADKASFKLDIFQNKDQEGSCDSDEFNSDATSLPVKKKIKKKKKKAKKKETEENTETENKIDDNISQTSGTEIVNKNKKSKKRNKAITYEELKHESLLLNQSDSQTEKLTKAKEKKLKKKNKRKSGQMENDLDDDPVDSSNKKSKNVTKTSTSDVSNEHAPQNTNNIEESLPNTSKNISTKTAKKLTSAKNIEKVESYFADDILYEELEEKSKTSLNNTTKITNEIIDIDILSSNSEINIEKFNFMNDTKTIDISSDSETEREQIDENTSSNSGNNIVLNIFSPEKVKENNSENKVTNPFSFVQNFEKINHKKSFKDIWTNDMNFFYNESWGHEDYDLNAVQQSMPADFSKWSINAADQSPVKKKRGPMCLRCREFGHLQFRCPKLHESIKCSTCGDNEHTTSRCPKSICTRCRSSTQHFTTSCNNCSNYETLRCPICNYVGHLPRDCPDLWRRYHLTNSDSKSLVMPTHMLKSPNMLWCSNCAKRGHSANNCTYLRADHFPTYPGIQSYTPVYNNVPSLFEIPSEPQIPVRIFENVNLSQIRNYRNELVENNNQKYLNMIKNLRRQVGKSDIDINLNGRLNYLQNAASNNRFGKRKIGELYKISKMLRNSR